MEGISVNKGATMKKLALGLAMAVFSSGVFAEAETAGAAAAGAGSTAGAANVVTTNALLITAGGLADGAVAAGSKPESNTTYKRCRGQTKCMAFSFAGPGLPQGGTIGFFI